MKKNYYVVGHETKQRDLILTVLVSILFTIIGVIGLMNHVALAIFPLFIGVTALLISLTVSFEANWIVRNDCIEYSSIYSTSKFNRALSIIFKNQQYPHMERIYFKDIESLEIIWNEVPMPPYGAYGYPIYLLIHLNNQEEVKLEIYVNESKQQPYPALKYLDEKIGIKDPYHIMDNLLDKEERLANYIIRIMKENHLKVH